MQSNISRGKGGIAVFLLSCWTSIAAADSLGRFVILDLVRAGIVSLENLPALEMDTNADRVGQRKMSSDREAGTEVSRGQTRQYRLRQIQLAEVQSQASFVDRCKRQSGLSLSPMRNIHLSETK